MQLLISHLKHRPRTRALLWLVVFWFGGFGVAHAQDAQQSQFYAAPLVQNPAFAGLANRPRVFFLYRTQWTGTGQPIKSTFASADIYLKKAKSGLGIVFGRTTALNGVFEGVEARLLYSFHQKLTKRWNLAYGLQLGLDQRNIGYSRLTFGDQIDSTGKFTPSSDPSAQDRNFVMPEVGGGLLLFDKDTYFSVSARHANSPKLGQDAGGARLPVWFSVTTGHVWRLGNSEALHDYYPPEFTLALLYKQQAQFKQLDLGAYYTLQPLVFGVWYRGLPVIQSVPGVFNHDALSLLVGIRQDNLSIGYSYDINLSGLVRTYAGSHEITLSYAFDQTAQRLKVRRALPCPSF